MSVGYRIKVNDRTESIRAKQWEEYEEMPIPGVVKGAAQAADEVYEEQYRDEDVDAFVAEYDEACDPEELVDLYGLSEDRAFGEQYEIDERYAFDADDIEDWEEMLERHAAAEGIGEYGL